MNNKQRKSLQNQIHALLGDMTGLEGMVARKIRRNLYQALSVLCSPNQPQFNNENGVITKASRLFHFYRNYMKRPEASEQWEKCRFACLSILNNLKETAK